MDMNKTTRFGMEIEKEIQKKEIKKELKEISIALQEKGYNPINQIMGYILSGDPTYVTNHNNARKRISKIDREEILEILLKQYLQKDGE